MSCPLRIAQAFLLLSLLPQATLAAVSAEEAAKLGKELTRVGAIRAGNADGSIPEYTGESNFIEADKNITPEDLQKLRSERPGAVDEILGRATHAKLFSITKENLAKHADKLTAGHQAMFERHPDFRMDVYQSVRTAFYPEKTLEETVKNATRAKYTGEHVKDAVLGFPFPIPKLGEEVMWNHKLKFRGSSLRRINNEAVVQPDGNYQISKSITDIEFYYANLKGMPKGKENMIFAYAGETIEPPSVSGQRVLVLEMVDESAGGRVVYLYNEGIGLRRVPRAGYDTPLPASFGELFADQADMFNGALDRYNWKLVGRQEKYIAYNSYLLNSPKRKYDEIIQKGFANRDYARYELHRVWVVEATLKEGHNHQLKRRTFYVDEDSWSIAAVDCYDNQDALWRLQEAHLITLPFIPTVTGLPEVMYDLQSGRYFITGLYSEERMPDWTFEHSKSHFSQRSLTRKGMFRWSK